MTFTVPVLTVSELNRQIRTWLEQDVGFVCVEGELSNLSKPSSGHFYFTLKDNAAQIRCVLFRNQHLFYSGNPLQNGQHIQAYGRLSLYEARGDYQLIIERVKEIGEGDLYRQFEKLKLKLAASGLFESGRKKKLPKFPHTIGIVTSGSGAALQDILTTIKRRYSIASIKIYPTEVQGKQAAQQLVKAIHLANQENACDVLILARGGGSLEDLWPFNDEHLAHCIAESKIPIVTGIGHEIDFTIADFVADLRAATPTAAAEAITPNLSDFITHLENQQVRLLSAMNKILHHKTFHLKQALQKIISPLPRTMSHWQSLDYLNAQLRRAMQQLWWQKQQKLEIYKAKLNAQNPKSLMQKTRQHLENLQQLLQQQIKLKLQSAEQKLHTNLITLHAVSPLATLERGYAIVTYQNNILFNAADINLGDNMTIRLSKGYVIGQVTLKGE